MKNFIKHLISNFKLLLKIKNPTGYYYEEKDTKCDNCCLRKMCGPFLCDVIYSADERQHVSNPPSYSCPKDDEYLKKHKENVTISYDWMIKN